MPMSGIPPAARAAAPSVALLEPPNEMGEALATERRGKIGPESGIRTNRHGNALVWEVEVPPNLTQQIMKFCIQHQYWNGKRRDGLSSGFGEARAWHEV